MNHKEGKKLTWELFEKELIARFGPIEYEYSDEALFRIEQHGTLRGYEREFERRLIGLLDGHRGS